MTSIVNKVLVDDPEIATTPVAGGAYVFSMLKDVFANAASWTAHSTGFLNCALRGAPSNCRRTFLAP